MRTSLFFSIVIPVRDRIEPLLKCLRFLQHQVAPPPFEVIVVDDGSRRGIEPQLANVHYSFLLSTVRQVHLGISAARNRGLSQARAAAALFIDSDCEADPMFLRAFADALDQYPKDLAFQASLHGHRDDAVGRIEHLRLQAVQGTRTWPDGRISYLNTSGFVLRRSERFPWHELFDVSVVRDEDTLLLARLAAQGFLPRFVPSAIVYHVPATSLGRYLWKQVAVGYRGQAARERLGMGSEIYLGSEGRKRVLKLILASLPPSFQGAVGLALVLFGYTLERLGRLIYLVIGMKTSRLPVLSAVVDPVTEPEVMVRMIAAAQAQRGLLVTYLNGWSLVLACQDQRFAQELRQFDLCYADGVGVIYALLLSSLRRVRKVTANEFFLAFCSEAERRGISLALIGARPGIAQELAGRLRARFSSLALPVVENGFFNREHEQQILRELSVHNIQIVVIGRGQPLQEGWACRLKEALPNTVIFCVGGLFDYLTGQVAPTSRWIRRLGFEWLHRFFHQPRTYWRYYIVGIPLLFCYILRQHLRSIDQALRRQFGSGNRGASSDRNVAP